MCGLQVHRVLSLKLVTLTFTDTLKVGNTLFWSFTKVML